MPPETPAADIARLLLERDLEGVVVLDIEGHAVGVVTRTELAAAFAQGKTNDAYAEDIMHAGVPQIPPDIPLEAAVSLMLDEGQRVYFLMHHAAVFCIRQR